MVDCDKIRGKCVEIGYLKKVMGISLFVLLFEMLMILGMVLLYLDIMFFGGLLIFVSLGMILILGIFQVIFMWKIFRE